MREVHVGKLPCVSCWDRPVGIGDQHPLMELIFLSVSKVLHPVLDSVVFSLVTLTQWEEVFRLLFLVVGIVMIFGIDNWYIMS